MRPAEELRSHVVPASGASSPLLLLVHGYGSSELHMATLGRLVDPRSRFTILAPRGPIELPHRNGAAWALPRRRVPEQFGQSLARLDAELDAQCEARGARREDVVVGGFSQGAILALALAVSPGRPVPAGVLSWCGTLPFDRGIDVDLSRLAGVPVLFQVGVRDDVIPVEAMRRSANELRACGASLTAREYEGLGHDVSLELLVDARRWLAEQA
jgi:phospholipase/carboxylesterase